MYKFKRLLFIHIMLLIYFIFICSQTQIQAATRMRTTTTTSTTTTPSTDDLSETETSTKTDPTGPDERDQDADLDHLSDGILKTYKTKSVNKIKQLLFGDIKGKPAADQTEPESSTRSASKAYVPRAMLEEYMSLRNSVRDIIPDDQDFMGKINIDDLDGTHDDIWSQIYNKYGSYDIQIDMGPPEGSLESRRSHVRGSASHIAHVGAQSEPEDVPPDVERYLPPHSRNSNNQKQFISVHLRFNLSQEVYSDPEAADQLKGAELFLARDRLYDCKFYDCNNKTMSSSSSPSYRRQDQRPSNHDRIPEEDQENIDGFHNVPRYQRVYILQVFGYDQYDEPVSKIISSLRIDTSQSTPLILDIFPIVRLWLINPKSNHGIIVRVTNDDANYERSVELANSSKRRRRPRPPRSNNETNSMIVNEGEEDHEVDGHYGFVVPPEVVVAEHVRLKRTFRETSESAESWIRKKPSLLLYSKLADTSRKHVKREHNDNGDDMEGMQADDPDASTTSSTRDYMSSPSGVTETSSGSMTSENSRQYVSSTDKPLVKQPGGSVNRRDQIMTANGRRGGARNPTSRNPSPSSSSSSSSNSNQRPRAKVKPSSRQAEKCGKRSMTINFEEVGWSNWIIAPNAFQANYCAGDCSWPLSDIQNATNHAIIQAIYHSVGRAVPRSCCAPVKLGRIAILYQLDGIVQMRQYDDMIVEACGCL